MARIIQVSCDSISCLNVIELADDDDYRTSEMLGEFSWTYNSEGDFCPECSIDEWTTAQEEAYT